MAARKAATAKTPKRWLVKGNWRLSVIVASQVEVEAADEKGARAEAELLGFIDWEEVCEVDRDPLEFQGIDSVGEPETDDG